MTEPTPKEKPKRPRASLRRRLLITAAAAGVVVLAAGAVLYLEREPIGARIAVGYLRDRGVPATITFDRLDRGGVSGRAVFGDPHDPDLVVDRMEVVFEPTPMFKGGVLAPRVRSIRLVRPRLKARFDGQRLTFGALQPLVDQLGKGAPAGPSPDIVVEGGAVRLASPYGELRLGGNVRTERGRLKSFAAALQPTTLRQAGLVADLAGATLSATGQGTRLSARLHLDIRRLSQGPSAAEALQADVAGELPYGADLGFDGAWRLKADGRAAMVSAGAQRLAGSGFSASFIGQARGPLDRLALDGSGTAALTADGWTAPGAAAKALALDGGASRLHLARTGKLFRFALDGDLAGSAARAAFSGVTFGRTRFGLRLSGLEGQADDSGGRLTVIPRLRATAPAVGQGELAARDTPIELTAPRAELAWTRRDWSLAAPVRLHFVADRSAVPVLAGELALNAIAVDLQGPARIGSAGASADLRGSLSGRAALSAPAARAVAASLPMIGTDPAGERAFLAAFRSARLQAPDFGVAVDAKGYRLALPRPVELVGDGGARLTVAQTDGPLARSDKGGATGALSLHLAGPGLPEGTLEVASYRLGSDRAGPTLAADARLRAGFTGESLKGLTVDAPLHLARAGGTITAQLSACAAVAAASFGEGPQPLLRTIALNACEDGRPVLAIAADDWRFHVRAEDFRAEAPASEAQLRDGRGVLDMIGTGRGEPVGAAELVQVHVLDGAAMKRYEPLALSGRLALARGVWTGPIAVKTAAKGYAAAMLDVRHVMATASGSADIAAPALAFAKDRLQPKDLSPIAASLATDAEGVVAFTGRAEWSTQGGVVSRGRLTAAGFQFRSAAGLVKNARADLSFTSLAPLVTAPAQKVGADGIDWLVPLEQPTATIALDAQRLTVADAQAGLAGGRVRLDPLTLAFAPPAPLAGTVRLDEIDVAILIQRFNLADKLTLQAKVDGVVPFALDGRSLKLDKGHVFAVGPGRLSIKREALTGAASAPGAPATASPNAVQDMAYQALENLAFDSLEADIASQPMGRLGLLFRIKGRNDPPKGGPTRISVFDLLRGHAFDKPVALPKGTPVNLTLDTSLNFDELLAAYANRGSDQVQSTPAKTGAETR